MFLPDGAVDSFTRLAQALGIAYTAGINLYATVAVLGIAQRMAWLDPLPGLLGGTADIGVISLASVLYVFEFLATLIPGVSSAWETFHSLIRPPSAAALAAAAAWHGDAVFVLAAALLGGTLAVATHTTKLGFRYAIDASPEPFSNGITNVAELGLIGAIAIGVWQHPWLALGGGLALLAVLIMTVRLIWRALRSVFRGRWMPRGGLLQEPRHEVPHHRLPEPE
ncbi:MAG: hypothetical protein NVS4B3_03970 [Gemmatimonadaceae bacterium]